MDLRSTDDKFVMAIEVKEGKTDMAQLSTLLRDNGAVEVNEKEVASIMKKLFKTGAQASAILFSSALLFSCDIDAQKGRAMSDSPGMEYAPQMYNSIPYESLKQEEDNKYNPGGLNMRVPARNTVARGKMGFKDYSADTASMDVMGAGLKNPLTANNENLEDGKVLYIRICAHCHGEAGAGDGLVAPKFKGVANLTAASIKAKPVGHIYQVITKGRAG